MSEYIKKEDALKAFEKSLLGKYILWDTQEKIKKDMQKRISQLPTRSFPEELSEDGTLTVHVKDGSKVKRVLVMGDNIFGGLYYPDSAKTDTAKPESDLISRTQAINDYAQCFADEYGMDCGEMFIGVLHQCPTFPDSAENKGEWIYDKGIYNWRCSRCGQTPPPTGYVGKVDFMETHFKFCPDCGADMREPKPKLGNSMLVGKPSLLNQIPIGEKGE